MNGEWKNLRGMKGPDRCLEANEGGNIDSTLKGENFRLSNPTYWI